MVQASNIMVWIFILLFYVCLVKYLFSMLVRKIAIKIMAAKAVKADNSYNAAEDTCDTADIHADKLYRSLRLYVLGINVTELIYLIPLCFLLAEYYSVAFSSIIPNWLSVVILVVFAGVWVAVWLRRCFIKTADYNLKLLKKVYNRYFRRMCALIILTAFSLILPLCISVTPVNLQTMLNMLIWYTLINAAIIAVCVAGVTAGKRLITAFYGAEGFYNGKNAVEKISFPEFFATREAAKSEEAQAAAINISACMKSACGRVFAAARERKLKFKIACCVAGAYIVLLIVSLIMFSFSSNIFRAAAVKYAYSRNTYSFEFNLEYYLGEPFAKTEDGNGNFVYVYYSENYVKIAKKIDALTEKAENIDSFDALIKIMEEQAKLEQQLEEEGYKTITAVGTSDGTSIYLDMCAGAEQSGYKWSDGDGKIEVCYSGGSYNLYEVDYQNLSESLIQNFYSDSIYVRIYYGDGSCAIYMLNGYTFSNLQSGENVLAWSDSWGSYSVTVNVVA